MHGGHDPHTGLRLSVVVIAYNLERFVEAALQSVYAQTRPADEIIVVDDCSTDRTREILRMHADRIRLIEKPANSGALLTALEGVKQATGDIVCMLDGDDLWDCHKLAAVERAYGAQPSLFLLSHDHKRIDAQGADIPGMDETHRNIAAQLRGRPDGLSDRLKATILEQRGYWLGSAYAFRRSAFDAAAFERQIDAFGPNIRDTYLDLAIAPFLVLTNHGGTVGYTPDTVLSYRVHGGGSMGGNTSPAKAAHAAEKGKAINALIYHLLKENGASNALLRRRELLLREYDFLLALYASRRFRAAREFAYLAAKLWRGRSLVKETQRFAAVTLLGPARFLELASRRSG